MLNLLIWYFFMAQPYLWCKCYVLFYALLHLLCVLDDFGGGRIPFFVHSSIVHEHWGASPFSFRTFFLDPFDCFFSLCGDFKKKKRMSSFAIFRSFNIVWFPLPIRHWICALDFTHILRNAHLMEELILYWLSKILLSFRQWIPMGEKFRGFKGIWFYAFVWFLTIFL